MNYIDIDLFGGIVSNADSEDIRPDIGQDIVNFTLDKAGTLKYNKKYITAASFDDLLVSGVIYWTDFTFNDQKFILIVDSDNNNLLLLNSNYQKVEYKFIDLAGNTDSFPIYNINAPTSAYKSMQSFLSTGGEVRISARNTNEPVLVQYISNRKFWGYLSDADNWFVQKKKLANNSIVYEDFDDGFFADISYPRMDYGRNRFMLSENSSDLDLTFEPQITATSSKDDDSFISESAISANTTDGSLVGNHFYESATSQTSFYVHEYAIAFVYDGNQIGPLSNSTYTRIATLDPHIRQRPRGMSSKIDFKMDLATMDGSTSTVRDWLQNPRITGIALYRAISAANYTRVKAKSALRRVGTYRIDRSQSDMKRVSISSSSIQRLGYNKMLTLDSARFSSAISDITSNTFFKFFWDSSGDSDTEEFTKSIGAYDDTYGIYTIGVSDKDDFIPDYLGQWAIVQSNTVLYSVFNTVHNSGIKAVGGEYWIVVPGNVSDGDGFYKNCIISEQTQTSTTKFDCIVESYLGRHVDGSGNESYYHALRLSGGSLWKEFKDNGVGNVYIYRTNEPIWWFHSTHNRHDSTNKTKEASISIFDTDPISFEGHPYPEDKINHGYEVQHNFMGRRFVGNVVINLGDDDQETHENMVLFSEPGMLDVVPSTNFIQMQNEFGGEVTGFSDIGADLYIFTTNTINLLNMRGPDPSTWILNTISNKVGCIASASIIKVKDRIYFAGEDSCYSITHTGQLIPISEPINDFYRELTAAAKQKTKTIYDADKGIVFWNFGKSEEVGGSLYVYELHLNKGDVTWARRGFHKPITIMAEDFDSKPAFISATQRISNPLSR